MKLWTFLVALFCILLTFTSLTLQYALYSSMPEVMEGMFNTSFSLHYGSYLNSFGLATVWSAGMALEMLGWLFSIVFLTPLIETKGIKFYSIYLRLIGVTIISFLQLVAFFLPSVEAFLLCWFFYGAVGRSAFQSQTFYLNAIAPEYKGYTVALISVGATLDRIVVLNLCRPSVFGSASTWFYIPILSFFLTLLPTLYLLTLSDPHKLQRKERARTATYGSISVDPEFLAKSDSKSLLFDGPENETKSIKARDVFNNKELRKILYLLWTMDFLFNVSPKMVDMSFSTRLHQMLGFSLETIMTIGSLQRIIFLPVYFLTARCINKYGTLFMLLAGNCVMLMWALVVFVALLSVYFSGASLLTMGLGILGDIGSGLTTAAGCGVLIHLILCEITPADAFVPITQIANLTSLVTSGIFSTAIPYAFTFFPPAIYLFFLVVYPPLIVYLYRNFPAEHKKSNHCERLS